MERPSEQDNPTRRFDTMRSGIEVAFDLFDVVLELKRPWQIARVAVLDDSEAYKSYMMSPPDSSSTEMMPTQKAEASTTVYDLLDGTRIGKPDFPVYGVYHADQTARSSAAANQPKLPTGSSIQFHERGYLMTDMCDQAAWLMFEIVEYLARKVDRGATARCIAVVPSPNAAWRLMDGPRHDLAEVHSIILITNSQGEQMALDMTIEQYGKPKTERFTTWGEYRTRHVLDPELWLGKNVVAANTHDFLEIAGMKIEGDDRTAWEGIRSALTEAFIQWRNEDQKSNLKLMAREWVRHSVQEHGRSLGVSGWGR